MDHDDEDPGMLAAVPGQYIAQASRELPDASTATRSSESVVIDTTPLWHGPVRIRYVRKRLRHGKWASWSWVAVHAEREPV